MVKSTPVCTVLVDVNSPKTTKAITSSSEMETKSKSRSTTIVIFVIVALFGILDDTFVGTVISPTVYNEIKVGVNLDRMGSWTGKITVNKSCIKMAIPEFCASHDHNYRTRGVLLLDNRSTATPGEMLYQRQVNEVPQTLQMLPIHNCGLVKELQPSVPERNLSTNIQTGVKDDIIWPVDSALPARKLRISASNNEGFWQSSKLRIGVPNNEGFRELISAGRLRVPYKWNRSMGKISEGLKQLRKLRIAVPNNKGFRQLINVGIDDQTNTTSITGFCVDVFHAAIDSLDYLVPYEFIPFMDENGQSLGSMTDLISQVSLLQNYDGIVGDITITGNRCLYMDFTVPFTDIGIGTITKRENKDMWFFLKPFHLNLWLTSAAFFILTGFVVWAIEHSTNQDFQGSVAHQIGTILWFGFSTFFYAHREKLTSNLSRFVVIVWLLVVLVLSSTYVATLSSMLTLQQIRSLSSGDVIGTRAGSILEGTIPTNLQYASNPLQLYDSPEQYAEALSRGSKKGGVDAIIDEIPYLKIFLAMYGADYAIVEHQSTTNGLGFAFRKGSPLVSDLSKAIIELREEGRLEMLEKKWFKSQASYMPENNAANPNILTLNTFGGLFLISGVSCVSAVLMHFFPSVINKFQLKNMIFKLLDGGVLAFIVRYLAPREGNAIELVNV